VWLNVGGRREGPMTVIDRTRDASMNEWRYRLVYSNGASYNNGDSVDEDDLESAA